MTGDSVADTLDVNTVSGTLSASDGGTPISGCAYSEASVTAIVVNAGDGDDTVNISDNVSSSIAITVNGGNGDDALNGGDGAETLNGEAGDDDFNGGAGNDYLSGGSNSDTFFSDNGDGADTMSGGDQNDTVDYRGKTANLVVTVGSGANDGQSGENDDVQADVETVTGGQGNDHITGDGSDELLDGYLGNDTMIGGLGADTLDGGDSSAGDTADYSGRSDNLGISLNNTSDDGASGEGDHVKRLNVIYGGSGNDTITGDTGDNKLFGNAGTDSIRGDDGDDSIDGGANSDTIYGEDGGDTLRGGGSTDSIYGGTGNDHVYGYGVLNGDEDDDIFYALNGVKDTINGGTGTDTLANYDTDDLDNPISIEVIL